MRLRVGHLYPEYLNIYADRGNIAVLTRRAEVRGHTLEIEALGYHVETHGQKGFNGVAIL